MGVSHTPFFSTTKAELSRFSLLFFVYHKKEILFSKLIEQVQYF